MLAATDCFTDSFFLSGGLRINEPREKKYSLLFVSDLFPKTDQFTCSFSLFHIFF